MTLLKFITAEERAILTELSKDKSLICARAYGKHSNPEKAKIVLDILKPCILGISEFSSFVGNDKLRIQYNYDANYDEEWKGNKFRPPYTGFYGVGYITLNELQFGFKEKK